MDRRLVLIAHNLRSCHNVGSLFRTAEGLGIDRLLLTGYTPYPQREHDKRLPHLAQKLEKQIDKTSLGAHKMLDWAQVDDVTAAIDDLKRNGYTIAALEQSGLSLSLPDFTPPDRLAVIVGREVEGIERGVLDLCDLHLEIPMLGQKESYNVVQAAAMALYHCRFH